MVLVRRPAPRTRITAPGRPPAPARPRRCQATGRPRPRAALPIGGFRRRGRGRGPRAGCRQRLAGGAVDLRGGGGGAARAAALGTAWGPGDSRAGGGAAWAGGAGGGERKVGERGRCGERAWGRLFAEPRVGAAFGRCSPQAAGGAAGGRAARGRTERPPGPDPECRRTVASTRPRAQGPRGTQTRSQLWTEQDEGQRGAEPASSQPALRLTSVDLTGVKGGWRVELLPARREVTWLRPEE
ncbi:translation initiation factor IF-2-like [Mustela erminea]|uniref:translation initiation factor IF-2-like n=1 Tax=Mustela erminea TaxID=36723 RepID=UPI0013868B1B|nr:translation initiation factor IF-2-like [Mustela erminea]